MFDCVRSSICLAFVLSCLLVPPRGFAELLPEHILILANAKVEESKAIARFYQERRKIPARNIVLLDLPKEDSISRKDYEQKIVDPVRSYLRSQSMKSIRVLVTIYGVPLKVRAPEIEEKDRIALANAEKFRLEAINILISAAEQAVKLTPESSTDLAKLSELRNKSPETILEFVQKVLEEASFKIWSMADANARKTNAEKLSNILAQVGGVQGVLATARVPEGEKKELAEKQLASLKAEFDKGVSILEELESKPTPDNQMRSYYLKGRLFGAVGVLNKALKEKQALSFDSADASVDSELSLLWLNRGDYELSSRSRNPWYYASASALARQQQVPPIMMISRLDAPTPTLVRKMIDSSILAEQKELDGEVFIDSRGLDPQDTSELASWDRNLKDLAWMLRENTSFDVTLDVYPELIAEAKNTALYAGWYRLRNYHDVFTFVPGAIGFHIASEEAVSIHDPAEKGWCRGLLLSGITATVGAVAEPYLDSFPYPQAFFGLLLSGRYSLVEAYYLSMPYVSWRMVLFGDPLYRPFRNKNLVSADDLKLKLNEEQLAEEFPRAPSDYNMLPPF